MTREDMSDSPSGHSHDQLEQTRPVQHAEQLLGWHEVAPGAFHKVINYLNNIDARLLLIESLEEFQNESSAEMLTQVGEVRAWVKRSKKLLGDTRKRVAKLNPVLSECCLIRDVVQPAIKHVNKKLRVQSWKITPSFQDRDYVVNLDAGLACEAIIDLLNNAVWAVSHPEITKKMVVVAVSNLGNEDQVKIEILDTGLGISSEDRSELFRPFFTTREDGTGLGLYFASRVIRHFGGTVSIMRSDPSEGTTVEVTLPFSKASQMKDGLSSG